MQTYIFSAQDRADIATFRQWCERYPALGLRFNCHTHTPVSDGRVPLEESARLAAECGFDELGVLDHNDYGYDPADGRQRLRAELIEAQYGVRLVCGMEISGVDDLRAWGGFADSEVHLGALYIDADDPGLRRLVRRVQVQRLRRTAATLELIRDQGYRIASLRELRLLYGNLTSELIASQVRDRHGRSVDVPDFVRRHLGRGGDCYVDKDYLVPVEEAIELIVRAGGLAELCHPLTTLRGGNFRGKLEGCVGRYVAGGLGGIEGITKYMTPEAYRWIREFGRERDIRVLGGSDTHEAGDYMIYVRKVNEILG